jgi:hypothetical protein
MNHDPLSLSILDTSKSSNLGVWKLKKIWTQYALMIKCHLTWKHTL